MGGCSFRHSFLTDLFFCIYKQQRGSWERTQPRGHKAMLFTPAAPDGERTKWSLSHARRKLHKRAAVFLWDERVSAWINPARWEPGWIKCSSKRRNFMTAPTEQPDTFRGCDKSCLCASCLRNSKRCCVYCRGWRGFLIPTGRDSIESQSLRKTKSAYHCVFRGCVSITWALMLFKEMKYSLC